MTTSTKSAKEIASEIEAEARRLLDVARILKNGPGVAPKPKRKKPKGGRRQ